MSPRHPFYVRKVCSSLVTDTAFSRESNYLLAASSLVSARYTSASLCRGLDAEHLDVLARALRLESLEDDQGLGVVLHVKPRLRCPTSAHNTETWFLLKTEVVPSLSSPWHRHQTLVSQGSPNRRGDKTNNYLKKTKWGKENICKPPGALFLVRL